MYYCYVRENARQILKILGFNNRLKIPLSKIAKTLDTRIEYVSATSIDGISASINERSIIRVQKISNKNRLRFTVAHELGHIALKHRLALSLNSFRVTGQPSYETQANIWAAEILMPIESVKRQAPFMETYKMATMFGVSVEAMRFRLLNLGLLCNESLKAV